MGAESLADKLTEVVVNPLILLLFAVGFLVFVYGIVEFMLGLSADTESKQHGKKHMLWGIIGMFVMAGAYGLFHLLVDIIGDPFGVESLK